MEITIQEFLTLLEITRKESAERERRIVQEAKTTIHLQDERIAELEARIVALTEPSPIAPQAPHSDVSAQSGQEYGLWNRGHWAMDSTCHIYSGTRNEMRAQFAGLEICLIGDDGLPVRKEANRQPEPTVIVYGERPHDEQEELATLARKAWEGDETASLQHLKLLTANPVSQESISKAQYRELLAAKEELDAIDSLLHENGFTKRLEPIVVGRDATLIERITNLISHTDN